MVGSWKGGKGSARRIGSSQKAYAEGWERIFGGNKKEEKKDSQKDPYGEASKNENPV